MPATPVTRTAPRSAPLGYWVTAVPLQHRNRAIPAALVSADVLGARWPAAGAPSAAAGPGHGELPAVPVVVAAVLAGLAAVGVLGAAVTASGPARREQ